MSSLQPVTLSNRIGRKVFSGQFAVAAGAITAGTTKFKGDVTVVRDGAGLYTFTLRNAAGNAWKGLRLARVSPTFITPPGGAAEGGWAWTLNADNMTAAGTFQLRINQQSWAAADPVQTVRIEFVVEGEVA